MRLYISARILFVQTSSRNQLFRRTGDGKTGRDDIAVPPFSMPGFDQGTTFGFPLFRRIGQPCRSVPVHQHFSGQHTHIIFRRNGEESGDGCWMYRCISHASCRSVPEQFFYKEVGHPVRMFRRNKRLFCWKGIVLQPIQQLLSVHPDYFGLRIMNMGSYKARHQEFTAIINHFIIGITAFNLLKRPTIDYLSFPYDQCSIGKISVSIFSI